MGNAGSMDHHTDLRGHNMPLKLPMPEPGELEERFAHVLVREKEKKKKLCPCVSSLCSLHASVSWDGTAVDLCLSSAPQKNLLAVEGYKGRLF